MVPGLELRLGTAIEKSNMKDSRWHEKKKKNYTKYKYFLYKIQKTSTPTHFMFSVLRSATTTYLRVRGP